MAVRVDMCIIYLLTEALASRLQWILFIRSFRPLVVVGKILKDEVKQAFTDSEVGFG